jgi:hypothetical protein
MTAIGGTSPFRRMRLLRALPSRFLSALFWVLFNWSSSDWPRVYPAPVVGRWPFDLRERQIVASESAVDPSRAVASLPGDRAASGQPLMGLGTSAPLGNPGRHGSCAVPGAMARRKMKKLQQSDLAREAALELPNREAMSLLQPGLGIVDMGATTQPGLEGTHPPDADGTPTGGGATPGATDPTGTPATTGSGLESKATRLVGPLPSTGA